jgi:hypothetical protein
MIDWDRDDDWTHSLLLVWNQGQNITDVYQQEDTDSERYLQGRIPDTCTAMRLLCERLASGASWSVRRYNERWSYQSQSPLGVICPPSGTS